MNLVSISENRDIEKRIAITPEIAKKYIGLGFNIFLPKNYGAHLGFSDDDYKILEVNFLDDEKQLIFFDFRFSNFFKFKKVFKEPIKV